VSRRLIASLKIQPASRRIRERRHGSLASKCYASTKAVASIELGRLLTLRARLKTREGSAGRRLCIRFGDCRREGRSRALFCLTRNDWPDSAVYIALVSKGRPSGLEISMCRRMRLSTMSTAAELTLLPHEIFLRTHVHSRTRLPIGQRDLSSRVAPLY